MNNLVLGRYYIAAPKTFTNNSEGIIYFEWANQSIREAFLTEGRKQGSSLCRIQRILYRNTSSNDGRLIVLRCIYEKFSGDRNVYIYDTYENP